MTFIYKKIIDIIIPNVISYISYKLLYKYFFYNILSLEIFLYYIYIKQIPYIIIINNNILYFTFKASISY